MRLLRTKVDSKINIEEMKYTFISRRHNSGQNHKVSDKDS